MVSPATIAGTKLGRVARRLNHAAPRGLPPLILMTDEARLPDPAGLLAALPRGTWVIVRRRDPAVARALAARLKAPARAAGLRLFLSADIAAARALGLDGVHAPARLAAALIPKARAAGLRVTAAAHGGRGVVAARGADAILVSPVFPTPSHPGAATLGPARLAALVRSVRAPVYALGGVTGDTAGRLAGTGVAGIAGIAFALAGQARPHPL